MQVVLSVRETQLGKKLRRLNGEKAVYRPLSTLANTLKRKNYHFPILSFSLVLSVQLSLVISTTFGRKTSLMSVVLSVWKPLILLLNVQRNIFHVAIKGEPEKPRNWLWKINFASTIWRNLSRGNWGWTSIR